MINKHHNVEDSSFHGPFVWQSSPSLYEHGLVIKLYNKHHTLEVSSFHGVFVWQSSYLSKFFWNEHALSDLPFFEEFHLFIGPLCDKYISHLLQFFSSWTCFLWSSKALFPRKLHDKHHTLEASSFHEPFVWQGRINLNHRIFEFHFIHR